MIETAVPRPLSAATAEHFPHRPTYNHFFSPGTWACDVQIVSRCQAELRKE